MLCYFDFNIHMGGAQIGTISLCSRLSKQNFNISIYDAYGKDEKYVKEINDNGIPLTVIYPEAKEVYIGGGNLFHRILRATSQIPSLIILTHRLRKRLTNDQIKLVWVNNTKSLLFIYLASIGLDIKKVLYHRGWAQRRDITKPFRYLIEKSCDALIAHSMATTSNLENMFPRKKVLYVPNSVDLYKNPCNLKSKDFKLSNNNPFIIILPAARAVKEKGHDIALKALTILQNKGINNIKLYFPGRSPISDSGEYTQLLLKFIKENKLERHVEFLGWIENIDELISTCDVAILPSHTEGFPRVVIEAMLVGTPVIATPVGGIPEAIIHNETGFLIEIDDYIKLAEYIEKLYLNVDLRSKISIQAQNYAKNHFSPNRQTYLIKELFDKLISKSQ